MLRYSAQAERVAFFHAKHLQRGAAFCAATGRSAPGLSKLRLGRMASFFRCVRKDEQWLNNFAN